ncbi:hypothetical protein CVV68_12835 [Arthrobacter livingstonensis]|uniref:FHA domain-containing protein n=1 Tax=Arthrobacter livingstonensis TaxID=670078 RepID=A0A2V5L7L1_9MICC|nr:RDD family protein [Arthrobacter livingstonensis]PYI66692.1 hypothetical protein CVV68_12835 [Arthrobacter livingstonensis]
MARKVAEACRNCGAELAPGSAFCTLCGTAVANRAAAPAPDSVPLGGPGGPSRSGAGNAAGHAGGLGAGHGAASPVKAVPGIIPVGVQPGGPLVAPVRVGDDPRLAAAMVLVPGGAGRRLVAMIVDGVLPVILLGAAVGVGAALTTVKVSGDYKTIDFTWLAVLASIASVLSLAYGLWLWFWEARSGKTPGNILTGLRTTNMDGLPSGVLAIFLRKLIIGLGSLVFYVGAIVVIISNSWDPNGKRQGWHDKLAHTLVFNVKMGRDPLETGGIAGRESYAPAQMPAISPVNSPMPAAPAQAAGNSAVTAQTVVPGQSGQFESAPAQSAPARTVQVQAAPVQTAPLGQGAPPQQEWTASPFAPPAVSQPPQGGQAPGPITGVPTPARPPAPVNSFAPPSQQQAPQHAPQQAVQQNQAQYNPGQHNPAQHNPGQHNPAQYTPQGGGPQGGPGPGPAAAGGEEMGETRVRPADVATGLRLTFDDGSAEDIATVALIGRNPAGYDGEMIERLVSVRDSSRSVSKTHLHVRVAREGLWVTDRNSTNGSAIAVAGGRKSALQGGTPALAEVGATVHFGDRYFQVGRA